MISCFDSLLPITGDDESAVQPVTFHCYNYDSLMTASSLYVCDILSFSFFGRDSETVHLKEITPDNFFFPLVPFI